MSVNFKVKYSDLILSFHQKKRCLSIAFPFPKLRLPHLANAYATAANIYYNNKEYYTSIYYYEKALEVFDETVGKGPVRDILVKNLNQAKKQRDMS